MSYYGNGSHDDSQRVKLHTRRPHRKTKTGCLTCKRRKIKCDEAKPECHNCIKHSLNCEYAPPQPSFNIQTALSGNATATLNLFDLELLHHFCTSTAIELHDNPTMRTLWNTNVPKLGFEYDYVMHGILALSALHLAHSSPERKDSCITQSRLHHHAGLLKGTPALAAYSDEHASAIYIFSALTTLYNFATTRMSDDFVINPDAGIAEWIVLCRQSYGIVKIAQETLFNGPVGQLFRVGSNRAERQKEFNQGDFPGAKQLIDLSAHISEVTENERAREACTHAVSMLFNCYSVAAVLPPEHLASADVFGWPFRVTEDFLELLQESNQEAMVVLAFFAVIAKRLDRKWWLDGFGDHIMCMVYRLMDEEHISWIQWPIQAMDWKPDESSLPVSQYPTPMAE
ncbi:related to C6 transcription factor [Phialocephala subalpina]|uniref:Related to C6 transcription factor n=1 Tax=Phialocephala subalpina TaxID=576137 RepID=A0A1L7WTB9_9HELO|nr:related to C6 transcription factor [Phialocephala subalpina]